MGNSFFRFKQFTVAQSGAAMKVGVDSVMLGAWASANKPAHILDIGTGTGLLALMAAQRWPNAAIDAIEIDPDACRQAAHNIASSPWNSRIQLICDSFAHCAQHLPQRYSLIICNPPYFTASLKPPDSRRSTARHNDSLPHSTLLAGSARLLTPDGVLATILPTAEAAALIRQAATHSLCIRRTLSIHAHPAKPAYRIMTELSATGSTETGGTLCIEKADRSGYTDEYRQLTRDFYINF